MAAVDLRGNPTGSASALARDAAERALARLMACEALPEDDLRAAADADDGWAMPHALRAGTLFARLDPAVHADAVAHLDAAARRADGAPPRERAHLQALQCLAEGRWQAAVRVWDDLLVDHPRDALALHWAHLWDHHRGDAAGLHRRPARALPEWDEADPLYPQVLALYAFGLQEAHYHPQAEDAGRRAAAGDRAVPWAVHAVAHVMAHQGRFEDGAAWLRQHQPLWSEGRPGLDSHLWAHMALFRLEALDDVGVLRLVDAHFGADADLPPLAAIDAAALLWRLHLVGVDVHARCAELAARLRPDDAGLWSYADAHAVLALLGAGDLGAAEHWVARCAARVLQADEAQRANGPVAREAGLPLMRGLLAFAQGDDRAALDWLQLARGQTARLGGTQSDHDWIDQTLIASATRGGRAALGRALLNERRLSRGETPLARWWMRALAG